jgi:hypothetical protein
VNAIGAGLSSNATWIEDPHVTLRHVSEGPLDDYLPFADQKVRVVVDAIFVRKDGGIAALRVAELALVAEAAGGAALPCDKAFLHVTVWKAAGVEAVESNALTPETADVMMFASPVVWQGLVRLSA